MDLKALKKKLAQCADIKALNIALECFLHTLGVSTFTFTHYAAIGNKNSVKYDFASANIASWHQYYLTEHFEEVDQDLQVARLSVLPIFWELKKQSNCAKTPREKQLREDSLRLKAQVEKGLSIPIHGPNNDFSILLIQQCKGEHILDNYKKQELDWMALGYLYYAYLRNFLLQETYVSEVTILSPREKACLRLAADGLTTNDIAKTMKISARTVRFHLDNINKKLGTNNKSQAIHLAYLNKIIQ